MILKKYLATAIVVVSLLLTVACEIVDYPPKRPESVDADAVWAGGVDGGSWVTCKDSGAEENTFRCRVFAEGGGLVTEDVFTLVTATFRGKAGDPDFEITYHSVPQRNSANDLLTTGYSYFDGQAIGLQNHTVLIRPEKMDTKFTKFNLKR